MNKLNIQSNIIALMLILGREREPEHRDPANGQPGCPVLSSDSGSELRLDNVLRYPSCCSDGRAHHRARVQVSSHPYLVSRDGLVSQWPRQPVASPASGLKLIPRVLASEKAVFERRCSA